MDIKIKNIYSHIYRIQQDSELHKAEKDFDLLTPRSIIQWQESFGPVRSSESRCWMWRIGADVCFGGGVWYGWFFEMERWYRWKEINTQDAKSWECKDIYPQFWQLANYLPRHFWRWFSFSQGRDMLVPWRVVDWTPSFYIGMAGIGQVWYG